MINPCDMYGSMVFSDHVMKQRLPADIYEALQKTIVDGSRLNVEVAAVVAKVMKDWAVERGATHYTHWFQPMTGITAEKHDSFLSPIGDGRAIMEFSGRALVLGETDASSLPSGGLRATFEARGYTAWDPTSYAFVRGKTLYIPTAFCSYGGEALDEKTPLLRSMQALSKQALRVLRLFGDAETASVKPMAGAEQEYFLIDKAMFEKRKDLMYTGRTLFGAKSPKGQELNDQYYGAIKPRVSAFMNDLNKELWALGVPVQTEHNESAPGQHELAAMYTTTNIATDHNQLIMEIMQSIAKEHGMICALHEKPFEGINGSGKHNNWSLATSTGINLLEPGLSPHENAQFLLFLIAVIKAVDDYQDLLRISVASAGNDCRLGGHEAPPAILSVYIGDELMSMLEAIENGAQYDAGSKDEQMKFGAKVLPGIPKDTTDRNRTSPFAFTGNKFEFRMVGSNMSIAKANIVINTTVAESLRLFADELEGALDFPAAASALIKRTIKEHKRIIFNGNGYDDEWVSEARSRGLLNLPATPDALPYMLIDKNVALYAQHKVFSHTELLSRYETSLENYCKLCNIEAVTMYKLVKKNILFVAAQCAGELSAVALNKSQFLPEADCTYERDTVLRLSEISAALHQKVAELYGALSVVEDTQNSLDKARVYRDIVLPNMAQLRELADELELLVSRKHWPFPTYGDLLFSVR
ncbi:MAG: glutamine synthetase III [Oscillospiraceae bacterium]|nr:glutamine synthetase III [Oscillospiraceae bacterium]